MELSDAGRELFLRVSGAFAELPQAAAHLRTAASRPRAVISVIASVGELWLLPCLAELGDTTGIQIIEDLQDPIDFAARDVDLRIIYGAQARQPAPAGDPVGDEKWCHGAMKAGIIPTYCQDTVWPASLRSTATTEDIAGFG